MSKEQNHDSEQKPLRSDKPPSVHLQPVVQRSIFGSDYAAAVIGEGIAFAGLCIGLGICGAEFMWALVIIWAFSFGPSKDLRKPIKPPLNDEFRGGCKPSSGTSCSASDGGDQ